MYESHKNIAWKTEQLLKKHKKSLYLKFLQILKIKWYNVVNHELNGIFMQTDGRIPNTVSYNTPK